MKSRDAALRLKQFEAEEMARKAADLEHMIREFQQMTQDLDRQIGAEEDRTGVKDANHFAYSTFAKAAGQRRANLRASIADLALKLENAVRERDAARNDLAAAASPELRDHGRSRRRSENAAAPNSKFVTI